MSDLFLVCPLKLGPSRSMSFARLPLPRMLDRRLQAFSGYDPIGWLGWPLDFMNSTGVLRPIEECSRT